MILGFLISFIVFGGLAYFISKLALSAGFDRENRFLAGLFYFLAPLVALSIISLMLIAAYSVLGFSASAMVAAIAAKAKLGTSAVIVAIGSVLALLVAIGVIAVIASGPATAFTASQICLVAAVIVLLAKPDRDFGERWLPVVAGLAFGGCMWPFAAMLTFGL